MRWKNSRPINGASRVKTRFAWWPTPVNDGAWVVWLERYVEFQTYSRPDLKLAGSWRWTARYLHKSNKLT